MTVKRTGKWNGVCLDDMFAGTVSKRPIFIGEPLKNAPGHVEIRFSQVKQRHKLRRVQHSPHVGGTMRLSTCAKQSQRLVQNIIRR